MKKIFNKIMLSIGYVPSNTHVTNISFKPNIIVRIDSAGGYIGDEHIKEKLNDLMLKALSDCNPIK